MTEGVLKRAYLDWWKESGDVAHMAAAFPDCACETADPAPGGFGPILDDEPLRYFVVSRSDIDLKRDPKKPVGPSIFKRCFKKGMSTNRLEHATREELNSSARILYDHQVSEHAEFGGVLGVIDFSAASVRFLPDLGQQVFCIVDTPLEGRPAHADVVSKETNVEPEVQTSIRLVLFNGIGGCHAFVHAADVPDCDLGSFKPAALKT